MRTIASFVVLLGALFCVACTRLHLTEHSIVIEGNTPLVDANGRIVQNLYVKGEELSGIGPLSTFWPGQRAPREAHLYMIADARYVTNNSIEMYRGTTNLEVCLGRFGPQDLNADPDVDGRLRPQVMVDMIFTVSQTNLYLTGFHDCRFGDCTSKHEIIMMKYE
jgi:hypothetical protein